MDNNDDVENTDVTVVTPDKVYYEKPNSQKLAYHAEQIRKHYAGESISDLMKSEGISTETLMDRLMEEFAREIDNLAGNRVIATENGENESSTVISTKRTEIIDRYIKAQMAKKEFEASTSIDVESPSMKIIFLYFLEKCQESFDKAGMNSEISDVFFRNFNDICKDTWKKDIKRRIAEIKV